MTALPRVFALTTDAICRSATFVSRARAIAASGAGTALVVRAPAATIAEQAGWAEHTVALARPHQASVLVHARPDLARAAGADGVQLRRQDLMAAEARRVMGPGWIGVSVHDRPEAEAAIAEQADFLVAGNVFETTSHPGRPAKGLDWLAELCELGPPVIAIGGVTVERAPVVRAAGAWGIAAITALWEADDPRAAAKAFQAVWPEE